MARIRSYAVGDEAVDDGRAVGAVTGGVLVVKLDGVAQLFGQSVLEALVGGVQSFMLNQLADADLVSLAVTGRGGRARAGSGTGTGSGGGGGTGCCAAGAAAGGQSQNHGHCQHNGHQLG